MQLLYNLNFLKDFTFYFCLHTKLILHFVFHLIHSPNFFYYSITQTYLSDHPTTLSNYPITPHTTKTHFLLTPNNSKLSSAIELPNLVRRDLLVWEMLQTETYLRLLQIDEGDTTESKLKETCKR